MVNPCKYVGPSCVHSISLMFVVIALPELVQE